MRIFPPSNSEQTTWLKNLWIREWGGITMVSRGVVYHVDALSSLLASTDSGEIVGAITFAIYGEDAELVSLNALVEGQGIGSTLLCTIEQEVRPLGVRHIHLVTSNDNLRALGFYQKRGYRLTALYPGAIDLARQIKPSIPLIAENGIPIHDEVVLTKNL